MFEISHFALINNFEIIWNLLLSCDNLCNNDMQSILSRNTIQFFLCILFLYLTKQKPTKKSNWKRWINLQCSCVPYLWHLCGCVASGPQHHHSQSWGDAKGGVEDICCFVIITQVFEQSQREGGVGLGQRRRWCHCIFKKKKWAEQGSLH